MTAGKIIQQLIEQPLVRDLEERAAQAVLALRYCIACRRAGRDPEPELGRRWEAEAAARRFQLVLVAIGDVWPDPFAVAPPCCPRLTYDEALLGAMLGAASQADGAQFDWLTAEMLSEDGRGFLFAALENFLSARRVGRA
ncbi:addiction module antidote protein [Sphingopyxis flava]|uniref:Addiction module antidote protein n=1 Tax=Sphingopyxis flava TaxID=1507287 RepID=A0A1T5DLC8_9SPHN|nr:addiction module antidote protein [Sphingopyxis flava]SKB72350.1 hypothetical protein SAMN06295937_101525 [Sphingopyxis flava]